MNEPGILHMSIVQMVNNNKNTIAGRKPEGLIENNGPGDDDEERGL